MSTGYNKGKPDPTWWLAQVRTAIEHRNKLVHATQWKEWRDYYRGNFAAQILPNNVFFKMIRTMVPRIYFRNPQVSITPRKGQQGELNFAVLAMLLERLDNTLIDQMKMKQTMKRAVQDGIMFGTGVLKLGYGAEFTPTPEAVERTEAPEDDHNMKIEYNDLVRPDMPWCLRCPTGQFIVQPGVADIHSARWVGMMVRRHIDDVREDPRFKHVANLGPGAMQIPGEHNPQKLENMVDLCEIRDKKRGNVFVLAPHSSEKILYEEDDDLAFNGRFNFYPIQFNTDDEYFWAVPDSYILAPHQKELNAIRAAMQRHRRISLIKFLVKQGALTPDALSKLNSDEVGAAIEVDEESNMTDVTRFEAADIPGGLLKMDAEENQTVQEILGMGVNQFGEYAPGSSDRSATESTIVNQATQIRIDERRDAVADTLTGIIEHMNHLILTKWDVDSDHIVDILGPNGAQIWVQFKTNELKGLDYDVKVDPDSSVPDTKDLRQQKAAVIFKTFQNNQFVDQQKLTRWTLAEVGGPPLVDLMAAQGAPQIGAPGTPGSTPNQPIPAADLIRQITAQRAGGQRRG
jgi:hypothetical protein